MLPAVWACLKGGGLGKSVISRKTILSGQISCSAAIEGKGAELAE